VDSEPYFDKFVLAACLYQLGLAFC
jgi:hypothetical protein